MKYLVPVFAFLALAAVHSARSASLESIEKEEVVQKHDGLNELKKIDQLEFEAAQKVEVAQMNVTEEQREHGRTLEAAQEAADAETKCKCNKNARRADVIASSDFTNNVKTVSVEERVAVEAETTARGAAADVTSQESQSSEEVDGRQRREHHEDVTVISLVEVREDSVSVEDVLE